MKIGGVLLKSDNALAAEECGRYPLTTAVKTLKRLRPNLSRHQCRALLKLTYSGEWHHVGKYANEVEYYDVQNAIDAIEDQPDLLDGVDGYVAPTRREKREVNVHIEWVEWLTKRDHYDMTYDGPATIKGDWIYFDGRRKKRSGNYISIREVAP